MFCGSMHFSPRKGVPKHELKPRVQLTAKKTKKTYVFPFTILPILFGLFEVISDTCFANT